MSPARAELIRPYRPGDEAALVDLYQEAVKRTISREEWVWKLKGRPSPVENVWVGESKNRLIAQYGTLPVPIRIQGETQLVLVGVDAMVHPAHRRRGVWTRLVQRAHASWAESGIPLVLGLPNEAWGSRVQALGWQSLFGFRYLSLPLRLERVLAAKLSMPWLKQGQFLGAAWRLWKTGQRISHSYQISQESWETLDLLQQLPEATPAHLQFSPIRDQGWYAWRYLQNPGKTYLYFALRDDHGSEGAWIIGQEKSPGRSVGVVVEANYSPRSPETARSQLLALIPECLRRGLDSLIGLAVPGSTIHDHLKVLGFSERRRGYQVRAVLLNGSPPIEALRDPHHWDLRSSDFDVH